MNIELEYRVRPVTRYIVTRYANTDANKPNVASSGSVEMRGEYDSPQVAESVAYALCKQEHEHLGWPVGDDRIRYPEMQYKDAIYIPEPLVEALDLSELTGNNP
jgi:hypothetical protein